MPPLTSGKNCRMEQIPHFALDYWEFPDRRRILSFFFGRIAISLLLVHANPQQKPIQERLIGSWIQSDFLSTNGAVSIRKIKDKSVF